MVAAPLATFARLVPREALLALGASRGVATPPIELVGLAWCLGASAMLARLAGGAWTVAALRRSAVPLDESWQRAAADVAAKLGIRRRVRVASAHVASPCVVGWIAPMILVPMSMVTALPPPVVVAVLAHELWHVRRYDYLVNGLQSAAVALLFFHPCAHWVSRRVRAEREHCCDDAAAALVGDPIAYARALVTVEELRADGASLAIAATKGPLMKRIERLVRPDAASAWRRPLALALGVVAIAGATAIACADGARDTAASASAAATLPQDVARWMPVLASAGARHGVDPRLLAAVTMIESRGDPNAKSPAGSVGLMQLMPATAARIAADRGVADYRDERLLDPAFNVDFGAYFLARQLETFGAGQPPARAVELAAAAYNAGPKALRAHLDTGAPLPDETVQYKALVVDLWKKLGGT